MLADSPLKRCLLSLICGIGVLLQVGCWAPLRSPGIPANQLPESFRTPSRTGGKPLNFSALTISPPQDYILGPNDQLDVTVSGLHQDSEIRPIRVQLMANGMIQLPLVGAVQIGGLNLVDAQRRINEAYAKDYLENPQVNLALIAKGSTSVIVLGEVNAPGAHILPKYQNDVGHAIAAAAGLTDEAADEIEVHRRPAGMRLAPAQPLPHPSPIHPAAYHGPTTSPAVAPGPMPAVHDDSPQALFARLQAPQPLTSSPPFSVMAPSPVAAPPVVAAPQMVAAQPDQGQILRIPLRTDSRFRLTENDITLTDGDVIVVPSRKHEVFFVVGKLNTANTVRFTIGDRERELGVGFVLPRDREIDVVTAVVMAGYIDPIDSPTTVTLHRVMPDGSPMLILVDLIEARCNPQATVLVEPGDIIYLNPDPAWYLRRTVDRIIPEILLNPYGFWMRRSIIGTGDI
ncbi:Polysaccharide biosynthesis/export protein [Roseimaritima ulvae]|uniref:Polysaccharide biosynthesis/export protein n=2 Tax=Roseimaritima ulvae TaxID=980254 RepID=A0A5B9QVS0_9BACT|nr:Polysaccharide biosynthesis/export protein [Roseimaritima ulvae]